MTTGIGRLLALLRRRPDGRELADRARQWFLARAERVAPSVFVHARPSPSPTTVARIASRVREGELGTLFRGADVVLDLLDDAMRLRALQIADAAADGRFDLLGYQALAFGAPPDWHLEPVSGKRSPLVPWKDLDSLDPTITGDKKIVWELNRHQHLLTLGLAYRHTGNDKYAETFASHVTSWIDANPTGRGINWVSSLELSFRLISWIGALHLFRDSRRLTDSWLAPVLGACVRHGEHLSAFLSTFTSPNTHLTGEALGLYYLGTCLPEIDDGASWRNLGRDVLLDQIGRHVRADGVYFEQTTWYHRYTTDFYLHFALLAERSGDGAVPSLEPPLLALLEHLLWMTQPDGTTPNLGDDDGGTLLRLIPDNPGDWRTVLATGAVLFGRGDFATVGADAGAETVWWFGTDAPRRLRDLRGATPPTTSRAFPAGGYFVMRDDWSASASALLIDCGPHGAMNCGHAHADALSLVTAARGRACLIDPGTFVYTASRRERDTFRSTAVHNTVTVDGQGSSVAAGPFQWHRVARCATDCWHDHPRFTFFAGRHDGFQRLPDPVEHRRLVLFLKHDYWLVADTLDARGAHHAVVHHQFSPGTTLEPVSPTAVTALSSDVALDLIAIGHGAEWRLGTGWFSPAYGRRVGAPVADLIMATATGAQTVLTLHLPRPAGQRPPGIAPLPARRGWQITGVGASDEIWHGPAAAAAEDQELADFEWVWVRRASDGRPTEAILVHGTTFRLGGLDLISPGPLSWCAVRWENSMTTMDLVPAREHVILRTGAGVGRIVVNGRPVAPGSWDVGPCQAARDAAECCGYVRN